ncbi:hypothetical protein [Lentzea flaviverrucosa]|uniref:DUF4064 domain-containing protein n=1 Tax=Lentzea flaviverrucosa TaxID=200379 RepID=A0A1H9P384_9PSEU|nr:hypothetical protein [Lentzea flaviverrucosa]RDI29989.1 hypothetical protein DFR72_105412 [Lentzea flaviverrucosa]SER42638.1 hypothetical protein SAMN05216195_105160 [Lentzea flaviverrucosa]
MTSPKESGTPGTITAGYWLVVAGAVLWVLAAVFQFANKQLLIDNVKATSTDAGLTPEMIESTATAIVVAVLVGSIVLAALAVWFAGKVKGGLKKSRTGLMITVLLTLFFQMIGNGLAVVPVLIAMSGLVLFYFRQSTEYLVEREQPA